MIYRQKAPQQRIEKKCIQNFYPNLKIKTSQLMDRQMHLEFNSWIQTWWIFDYILNIVSFTILVDQPKIRLFQPKNEAIMPFFGSPAYFVIDVCAVQLSYRLNCVFLSTVSLYSKLNHIFFFSNFEQNRRKNQIKLPHLHHDNILSLYAIACCVLSQSEQENEQEYRRCLEYLPGEQRISHKNNVKYGSELGCTLHMQRVPKKTINNLNCKLKRLAGYNSMKGLHMFIVMFMRGERKYQTCASALEM